MAPFVCGWLGDVFRCRVPSILYNSSMRLERKLDPWSVRTSLGTPSLVKIPISAVATDAESVERSGTASGYLVP